jgi:hypothetical protein
MKTMKSFLLYTFLVSLTTHLSANAISTNQTFAVRDGTQFRNTSLDAYEGKILVIMLMTPWCPSCQSNASAVGDGVIDFFHATNRGVLRGKNNQGIEIDSILLSTEPASNWDSTNSSFASKNAYEQWGLDADAARANPRALLGFYRGGFPNGVNSSNLYDWGDDRRRVVVLNMVKNSPTHAFRQIIINQNEFDSGDAAGAQSAINEIAAAPVTMTFVQWSSTYAFPSGMAGALHDPDQDGRNNMLEFFHGTHPLHATGNTGGTSFVRDGNQWKFVYRMAKNISGHSMELRSSTDLVNWSPLPSSLPQTSTAHSQVDEVSVTLPSSSSEARYYQLVVRIAP